MEQRSVFSNRSGARLFSLSANRSSQATTHSPLPSHSAFIRPSCSYSSQMLTPAIPLFRTIYSPFSACYLSSAFTFSFYFSNYLLPYWDHSVPCGKLTRLFVVSRFYVECRCVDETKLVNSVRRQGKTRNSEWVHRQK